MATTPFQIEHTNCDFIFLDYINTQMASLFFQINTLVHRSSHLSILYHTFLHFCTYLIITNQRTSMKNIGKLFELETKENHSEINENKRYINYVE